jgi:cystathionine beta-lyase
MSHASVPPDVAATRALPPDLVRISVGIEDADDLIADLDRAFASANRGVLKVGQKHCGAQVFDNIIRA